MFQPLKSLFSSSCSVALYSSVPFCTLVLLSLFKGAWLYLACLILKILWVSGRFRVRMNNKSVCDAMDVLY